MSSSSTRPKTTKTTSHTSSHTSTSSNQNTAAMSRSVLAPLTTVFTPPPACATFAASGGLASTENYWIAQSCNSGFPADAASCWPPALVTTPGQPLGGWGFYSPGISCPVGYSSACTGAILANGSPSSLAIGTSFSFQQFPLMPGETAIGCCPQGLSCTSNNQGVQTCATVMTTGRIPEIVGFCANSGSTYDVSQSISVGIGYTPQGQNSTTITLATASLFGPLIQLVFQSTDIPSLASPTTFTTSTAPPITQTSGPYGSTTSGAGTSTDGSSDGGLSTGAKIGIGVGVPLGVLLIAGLLAFIFFRRRAHARNAGPMSGAPLQNVHEKPDDYTMANYPANGHGHGYGHGETYKPGGVGAAADAGGKWRGVAEAPDSQRTAELQADGERARSPVELPDEESRVQSWRPGGG